MNADDRKLKNLIRLLVVVVILILALGIFFISWLINHNPYGTETVTINDLSQSTAGASDKQILDYIQHDLYMAISYNVTDIDSLLPISDAVIRPGSLTKTYNESKSLYDVYFIVDIPSLQQSYAVAYQWGPTKTATYDEWGTQVTCLPQDQLIYGDFNCRDMSTLLSGSNDPLMEYLPVKDYDAGFNINATTENNIITNVDIYLYSCREDEITQLKADVTTWFTERGLDFSAYPVTFSAC